jgi:hypothetical protein
MGDELGSLLLERYMVDELLIIANKHIRGEQYKMLQILLQSTGRNNVFERFDDIST